MSASQRQKWTIPAYLEHERSSEQRHEYLNGDVFAMAGASANHNLIAANILASLHAQLRKSPCVVYPSDMRVKVSPTGLYTYPDLSVERGTSQFEDDQNDTLLNPTLIVEILSPSTENYDRGRKFQHYRSMKTLQEYLLIAQESVQIERYVRHDNEQWLLSETKQIDDIIEVISIGCKLALVDMYEKVTFKSS